MYCTGTSYKSIFLNIFISGYKMKKDAKKQTPVAGTFTTVESLSKCFLLKIQKIKCAGGK
jgi:hypothetical protein